MGVSSLVNSSSSASALISKYREVDRPGVGQVYGIGRIQYIHHLEVTKKCQCVIGMNITDVYEYQIRNYRTNFCRDLTPRGLGIH